MDFLKCVEINVYVQMNTVYGVKYRKKKKQNKRNEKKKRQKGKIDRNH